MLIRFLLNHIVTGFC